MLNVESEKLQCTQWYDTYLNIVILICTKLVFCLHWFVWCVMYCVVSPISPRFIGIQYVYSDVTKGWGRRFCPPPFSFVLCVILFVFCLFVIVIIITCICSGDQLWWCIPSGSLPLYCFSFQLLFFIVVNKISKGAVAAVPSRRRGQNILWATNTEVSVIKFAEWAKCNPNFCYFGCQLV